MGGRGASSGVSVKGKPYGTEYETLLKRGNIKFVRYLNSQSTTTPMETMHKGRIYVTVNKNDIIKSVTFYDKNGKRKKQIDLTHFHKIDGKNEIPHSHHGYQHDEKGSYKISLYENKLIDKIYNIWHNRNRGK